jgi:hypothetical protein
VVNNTSLPVSIKIRAGIKKKTALDFLDNIGDLNWKTLMIHGRTFEEGFAGPINVEIIKEIKKIVLDLISELYKRMDEIAKSHSDFFDYEAMYLNFFCEEYKKSLPI